MLILWKALPGVPRVCRRPIPPSTVAAPLHNLPYPAPPPQDLQCLVTWYDKHSCLRGGTRPGAPHSAPRGLLPHEFDHWLEGQRRGWRGQGAGQAGAGGRLLAESGAGGAQGPGVDGHAATASAAAGEQDLEPGPHNTVQVRVGRHGCGSRGPSTRPFKSLLV